MSCEYVVKNVLTSAQLKQLHTLCSQMWWSKERTREEILISLKNCIAFAAVEIHTQRLVGFARVLTDQIKYAYIYDVMTEESLRGKGIATMIINSIISHHELAKVKYIELTCSPDMARFYNRFGFNESYGNTLPMRLTRF